MGWLAVQPVPNEPVSGRQFPVRTGNYWDRIGKALFILALNGHFSRA